MVMDLELVCLMNYHSFLTVADRWLGWYDSVYDEELGSQPCIFTSVTPVSFFYMTFACFLIPALTAGLE